MLINTRNTVCYLVFSVLFFIVATTAHSQWLPLHTFGKPISVIHFLDREKKPSIGFVGLTGEIWRTSDRGKTWVQTTTPALLTGSVRSFSFKDSLVGWSCASQPDDKSACFKTTDGGFSWSALSPVGDRTFVYFNPTSQALILGSWNRQSVAGIATAISIDDGANWNNISNTGWMNGVAFTTPLLGVMSTFRFDNSSAGNYSITTDGGLTWNNTTEARESWQPVAIPNSNTLFASAEGPKQILQSSDNGTSWQQIFTFNSSVELTGDIRGDASVLYVQTRNNVFVSGDQGKSWLDLCGPGNDPDTRMYWVSDTLWAGDLTTGTLWYNPYGLKNNDKLLQFQKNEIDFISNGCVSVDSLLRMQSFSTCDTWKVLILQLDIAGKPVFTMKKPILPKVVGTLDSIRLSYNPDDALPDSAKLHIKYSIGGIIKEIFIPLKGRVIPGFQAILQSNLSATISTDCNAVDTFVTITAGTCDSLTVVTANIAGSSVFTLGTATIPTTIAPNKTYRLPIHIAIAPIANYSAQVLLRLTSGGITRDTTIQLSVDIVSNTKLVTSLSKPVVQFDSVTTCDPKFDTIYVRNTLCKKLYLSSVFIQPASADFAVVSTSSSLPDSLGNNSVEQVIVAFAPKSIGKKIVQLHLTISLDNITTKDTSITLEGIGIAGSNITFLAGNLLQFNQISVCDTLSQIIQLLNSGCDSLTIIQVVGSSGGDFSISNLAVGTIITPGSVPITVEEHPTSSGTKYDSIQIKFRASSGAEQWLTIYIATTIKPKQRHIVFDNVIRLDSLSLCTPFDTVIWVKNLGVCDTLVFDAVSVSGFALLSASSSNVLRNIAPGDSLGVTIHISPANNMQGTAVVRLHGPMIDTIFTIITTSRSTGPPFTLSIADSVFASTFCNSAKRLFTFKNASCDTILLDNLSLIGSGQFMFVPNPVLPHKIAPGDSLPVIVEFDPSVVGDSLGLLNYHILTGNVNGTVQLRGRLQGSKQMARIIMQLDANSLPVQPVGVPLGINLISQDAIDASIPMTSLQVTLSYNDNMLTPLANPANAMPGWSITSVTPKTGALDIDLARVGNTVIGASSTIAHIVFATTIGNIDKTTITTPASTFNNGDPVFNSCVLSALAASQINFSLTHECGEPYLVRYLATGKVFDNIIVAPNPVGSNNNVTLQLLLHRPIKLIVSLSDILGRKMVEQQFDEQETGLKHFVIPIGNTASGNYTVRIYSNEQTVSVPLLIKE